MTTISPA
ncbi:hypothetical protein VCHC81A2_3791, partial [Vibrio cholerae HC-81A2]